MRFWKTKFSRYSGSFGYNKIEPVEVERATEACVWVGGRRRNRLSEYDCFFESWELAYAYLMENAHAHVIAARNQLQMAQDVQGNIKGLKRPVETECHK